MQGHGGSLLGKTRLLSALSGVLFSYTLDTFFTYVPRLPLAVVGSPAALAVTCAQGLGYLRGPACLPRTVRGSRPTCTVMYCQTQAISVPELVRGAVLAQDGSHYRYQHGQRGAAGHRRCAPAASCCALLHRS